MIRTIGRFPAERSTTYKIRKVFDQPDSEEHLPLDRIPPSALGASGKQAAATGY
jgi:hypothetical protein